MQPTISCCMYPSNPGFAVNSRFLNSCPLSYEVEVLRLTPILIGDALTVANSFSVTVAAWTDTLAKTQNVKKQMALMPRSTPLTVGGILPKRKLAGYTETGSSRRSPVL